MSTLGSFLSSVSVTEGNATVGAYTRTSKTGKQWIQYRLQLAGTAGTFVSPIELANRFGQEFVNDLTRSVINSLKKLKKDGKLIHEFEVGLKGKKPFLIGRPSSLTEGGIVEKGSLPFKTGAIRTDAGSTITVSGQIGQLVMLAQNIEIFHKQGPLIINRELDVAVAAIMKKMVVGAKVIAEQIVAKRVYETKARVTNKNFIANTRRNLADVLEMASVTKGGSRFGEYEPQGNLMQAVLEGIRLVDNGQGFIVGVDEEFLKAKTGKSYWVFVEQGHRVVLTNRHGESYDTGAYVVGRPFMQEIQEQVKEYMQGIILNIKKSKLQKRLGDVVFSWFTNVRSEMFVDSVGKKEFLTVDPDMPYGQVQVKTPFGNFYEGRM